MTRPRIWANDGPNLFTFDTIPEAVDHFVTWEASVDRAVIFDDEDRARDYSAELTSLVRDANADAAEQARHERIESAMMRVL